MKKLMKIVQTNDQYMLEDNKVSFNIPMELNDQIHDGELWLVDIADNDVELVVQSLNDTLILYQDEKFIEYSLNGEDREIDDDNEQNKTTSGHEKELFQDLNETKELMQKAFRLDEETHNLSSGKEVTIKGSVQGGQFTRYCKELDYVSVSPLSLEIVKQMVNIYAPIEYDATSNSLHITNGLTLEVNENDLHAILDDLYIVATPDDNNHIIGQYVSSKLVSNEPRHIADYPGGYTLDTDGSMGYLIMPNIDWIGNDHLKNLTKFNFPSVTYDQFKSCITDYIDRNIDTLGAQQLCELINKDFENFGGSYINLTIFDKIDIQQRLQNEYDICLDCQNEKELRTL